MKGNQGCRSRVTYRCLEDTALQTGLADARERGIGVGLRHRSRLCLLGCKDVIATAGGAVRPPRSGDDFRPRQEARVHVVCVGAAQQRGSAVCYRKAPLLQLQALIVLMLDCIIDLRVRKSVAWGTKDTKYP
jgi:hypothetical protein